MLTYKGKNAYSRPNVYKDRKKKTKYCGKQPRHRNKVMDKVNAQQCWPYSPLQQQV